MGGGKIRDLLTNTDILQWDINGLKKIFVSVLLTGDIAKMGPVRPNQRYLLRY